MIGVINVYIDKSIKDYLDLVESGEPFPGGGSVAALVSSLGAALTLMTSNFSFDKEYFKELDLSIQEKVKQTHRDIKKSINKINKFIDEDAKGFASVIEAYDEEKPENEEEKKKRLEDSYKKALDTPLKCSRECLNLLNLQKTIVKYGNNQTITDVGVGVILVYAALEGCLISIKINLNYIEDKDFIKKIQDEVMEIYKKSSIIKNSLTKKIIKILES